MVIWDGVLQKKMTIGIWQGFSGYHQAMKEYGLGVQYKELMAITPIQS